MEETSLLQEGCDNPCEVLFVREDVVERVKEEMPASGAVREMAEVFKLLGDPTRLTIIHALALGELCVCDLAAMFGLGETAVSNHLRLLRGMRLVRTRREGKLMFYSLADDRLLHLLSAGRESLAEAQR